MDIGLREVVAGDGEAIQRLMDDPDVRQWNPMRGATAREWLELRSQDDAASRTWAIADAGRFVGTISLTDIDLRHRTADVGYRVLATERGRGVGTAALGLVTAHAFDVLGLRRVQLYHALANPGSCRVAERSGFALEGTVRQAYVYGDGRPYDEHLHARLVTDR
ncbi:GNAT family N-acetyltransferase [Nocardioides mangrovicus]|uniref:GNAT family N-acetyltransferase n=1 Tax=Nocardioides mangrovicus TaxID=2478913 RepID=UPI0018E0AEC2|nr:GNAT family protein [Nocardioides mangrovicus]